MSDPIVMPGPVRRVVAFEDRAELTREVAVEAPAGRVTVRLTGVTPLMDDARLTARVDGVPGATVEDVRVIRRWAHADVAGAAARAAELERARAAARAAADAAKHALRMAEANRGAAQTTLRRYLAQVGRVIWQGAGDWQAHLGPLEAALDAAEAAVAEAEAHHQQAAQAVADLDAHRAEPDHPDRRLDAELEVRFTTPTAGRLTLTVSGVTPCALWRPSHQADLRGDSLTWTTFGTVWQRTGEAWTDVDLVLSTDRPAAGAHLPTLAEDEVRLQPKAHKKQVVLAYRDEAISTDDGDAAVPGVDDGGQARQLRARQPASIPSDGLPHRVAAGGFTCDAPTRLLTRPALAPHVFLTAELRNTGAEPLLAGPVILQRDGAWVGTGDVAFIGAGEPFELSFGSDDRFTVRYRRRRRVETRRLAKDRTHFTQEVTLQFAGSGQAEVGVELRLPVSEIAALTIEPSKGDTYNSEGRPAPDADGRVTHAITLASGDLRTLSLGFWLDRGSDVVLPDPW